MKKYKYIISILILISIFSTSFASEDNACNDKELFELYTCRKDNICKAKYSPNNENKAQIVYDTEKNEESKYSEKIIDFWLDDAKEIYKENMNNIYKCWILKIQKNSFSLIKDKLLAIDKWWAIKNNIEKKIDLELKKIDLKFSDTWCIDIEATTVQNKFNILNNATYELCRYHSYLLYLKEYNSDINKALFSEWWASDETWWQMENPDEWTKANEDYKKNQTYSVKKISGLITAVQTNIDNEIEHIYKVFPIAYHAYSEYENNFPIHTLLQIIREDFIVLRTKLYSAINPINQVVYKISNAMSK